MTTSLLFSFDVYDEHLSVSQAFVLANFPKQ